MDPSKDVSDLHNFVLFLIKMIVTVFNTASMSSIIKFINKCHMIMKHRF